VTVGAGIIGLAVAYHLRLVGAEVTIVDSDPEGDKASSGNAGGIATTEVIPASAPGVFWRAFQWMLDPLGPVSVRPTHIPRLAPWLVRFANASSRTEGRRIATALSALNGRVYDDLLPMLKDAGRATDLHRRGALTVYSTGKGFHADRHEWSGKQELGVVCEHLSGDEARAMEPALGPLVQSAVFTPQWSHVSDPNRILSGLRTWLTKRDVAFVRGDVRGVALGPLTLELSDGGRVSPDAVVVAGGAWSGALARMFGDRISLESERGYNTTITNPNTSLSREIIFAEHKFVATPLDCGLRIGGAAEFGGLNAAPNWKRSLNLVALAQRFLPDLRPDGATVWSGHRPATPDSLPVIGRSKHHANVFYAFGHGHLGLTQAATTGRLIAELVQDRKTSVDITPFSIERFG